jgi:class 3 adenylate cyclase
MQWVFGDNWGVRSIDGYATPSSVENRIGLIRFALRIVVVTALVALFAITLVPIARQHINGLHLGWFFVVLGGAVVLVAPAVIIACRYLALWWIHVVTFVVEILVYGALALSLGPALSPYIALGYVTYSAIAFVTLTRRTAMIHMGAIGASYGFVLAQQAGNTAPVTRWIIVMGAVVVIGQTLAWLVDRLRTLAVSEHQARDAADTANAALEDINWTLESRVQEQVGELERLGRLRRFLSTPVADAVLSSEGHSLLEPHRREISVFFCDLRGFTAFAANAQPEEVLGVLGEYFDLLGDLINRYQATVGAFTGDGLMAFFNDPLPCDEPALRAITMAVELRSAMESQMEDWTRKGYQLGFGVGISFGYANLGMIGFEGRRDYSALGPVVNLSARLCGEAKSGQILIDQRAHGASHNRIHIEDFMSVDLKGFSDPVPVFSVAGLI